MRVWGVVVGLPGPVDFTTGQPVAPPIMPDWNRFDVRTPFEKKFRAPVWVDNDSNLLALGERARHRDSFADLMYCKIGSHFGPDKHVQSRRDCHRWGGWVSRRGVLAEVRQRAYELSFPLATRDLTISLSVYDDREPLRGGAELALEQLFDVTFPRWFAEGRPSPERLAVLA